MSASADAKRFKHALREIADLGDGVPMWVAGGIASRVADRGMTFEEALADYEDDKAVRAVSAGHRRPA